MAVGIVLVWNKHIPIFIAIPPDGITQKIIMAHKSGWSFFFLRSLLGLTNIKRRKIHYASVKRWYVAECRVSGKGTFTWMVHCSQIAHANWLFIFYVHRTICQWVVTLRVVSLVILCALRFLHSTSTSSSSSSSGVRVVEWCIRVKRKLVSDAKKVRSLDGVR